MTNNLPASPASVTSLQDSKMTDVVTKVEVEDHMNDDLQQFVSKSDDDGGCGVLTTSMIMELNNSH